MREDAMLSLIGGPGLAQDVAEARARVPRAGLVQIARNMSPSAYW